MLKKMNLKSQLTLVVILSFFVTSIVLASLNLYSNYRLVKSESEEKLMNLVQVHAMDLDKELIRRKMMAESIYHHIYETIDINKMTTDPNYLRNYEADLESYMYNMAATYGSAWVYFSPYIDGNIYELWFLDEENTGKPRRMPSVSQEYYDDETNKEWFFVPMRSKEATWIDPYDGTLFEDPNIIWISYSVPIYMDDVFIGVCGNDIQYLKFVKKFTDLNIYGSGYGLILNSDYRFVVHPELDVNSSLDEIASSEFKWITDEMALNRTGVIEYTWIDNKRKTMAYTHLSNGWIIGITATQAEIYSSLYRQLTYILLLILIGILVASFVVYGITSRMTRELGDVTQIIAETGRGDYDTPIPDKYVNQSNEVGTLAQAVEMMREKQKESFAEIHNYNEDLERLVDERTQELDKAYKDLIASKRIEAINGFIIEIFHRMNTPLGNAAMGLSYVQKLIDEFEPRSREDVLTFVSSLEKSVQIMDNGVGFSIEMVDSLRQLSILLGDDEHKTFKLYASLTRGYEFYMNLRNSPHLSVEIKCPDTLEILTNEKLIHEIMTNFLRYTEDYSVFGEKEKKVSIHVESYGNQIELTYRDNSDLRCSIINENIFEPFILSKFDTGSGGMELNYIYNIVTIGLNGKIYCLADEEDRPYFKIEIDFEQ